MHKKLLLAIAALSGGTGCGAWALLGHMGLKKISTDEKIIHGFQTGVQYQMYHALALLAVAILFEKFPDKWMKWAGALFYYRHYPIFRFFVSAYMF